MDDKRNERSRDDDKVIFITISLVVLFTVLFSLAIYIFFNGISPYEEDHNSSGEINLRGSIDADNDHLVFEQNSGEIPWERYCVVVNNRNNFTDLETRTIESHASELIFFTGPDFHPEKGIEYNIKIVNIEDNLVIWEKDIIAE